MLARWRFRVVMKNCRGEYLLTNGQAVEYQGSDADALARGREILAGRTDDVAHVQVVSVGCPADISDCPGRLLAFVRARRDGRGWMLGGDTMHGSWHRGFSPVVP